MCVLSYDYELIIKSWLIPDDCTVFKCVKLLSPENENNNKPVFL